MSADEEAAAAGEGVAVSAATEEKAAAVSGVADGTEVTIAREEQATTVRAEEKAVTAAA